MIKNTLFLTLAQMVSMPLAILSTAVSGRYLGAAALGYMYLASTMNMVGNLAVDWGQAGALPQLVARDRAQAGALLGSSLAWRTCAAAVVFVLLMLSSRALGYANDFLPVLAILACHYFLASIGAACQQVIIGFERTDVSAYRQVLEGFLSLVITVPILLLGGGLIAALLGGLAALLVATAYCWYSLRLVGVTKLSVDVAVLKELLARSTPFAFTGIVGVLQPYLDVLFLSTLSTPEVMGWHAATRRLIGVLIFPGSAMIGALYPTLCRLFATDQKEFLNASNGALRGTCLMVFPVALGCFLYADIGVAIFSEAGFGPAQGNLRIMALFLFLVYFAMPLGSAILAAGKQRAWAIVQSLCVVVSLVADPLLIPIAQRRFGNGGLGVCIAAVLSEVLVVACALWLIPRGTFDRRFWRAALSAALGGAAMATVAHLLRPWSSFLGAPIAVVAYAVAVWAAGGLEPSFVLAIKQIVVRKAR